MESCRIVTTNRIALCPTHIAADSTPPPLPSTPPPPSSAADSPPPLPSTPPPPSPLLPLQTSTFPQLQRRSWDSLETNPDPLNLLDPPPAPPLPPSSPPLPPSSYPLYILLLAPPACNLNGREGTRLQRRSIPCILVF